MDQPENPSPKRDIWTLLLLICLICVTAYLLLKVVGLGISLVVATLYALTGRVA